MKKYLIIGLLLTAAAPLHAVKGESLSQRVDQLERILRNQNLSDIVLQLQQMQQEMQQLRGEVEMQKHAIDALKRRQRDLYLDLDGRLSQPGDGVVQPQPPTAARSAAVPAPPPAPVQDRTEPRPAAPTATQDLVVAGDPAQEQAEYQKALSLLKQGNYPDAIVAFGTFLGRYPDGSYADNAQYWLGEASYVMRDFDAALGDFDQVLQRYPTSTKVPGAMLKMGYIHYEKGHWAKARKVLGELVNQYPNSTESRLAQHRLDRMRKEGR